jgi:excisionase family DNA binding protein
MADNIDNNELLTITEFAATLRLKPSCIRRWLRESRITSVHVGRLVRIPASEVTRVVTEGTRLARTQRETSRGVEK